MDNLKKVWEAMLSILLSTRVKTMMWLCVTQLAAQILGALIERASELDLSQATVVVLGFVLSQVTKALNNRVQGKPMGFVAEL